MPKEWWLFISLTAFFTLLLWIWRIKRRQKKKVRRLAKRAIEMTPEEFLAIRQERLKRGRHSGIDMLCNFAGVYILYNKTKKMYYVGQGKQVISRVNNHFTGKGNGDVYADYKYGDVFKIRLLALEGSGFKTLNDLERETIKTYDAFAHGYNKTRGNKR